MKKVIILAIATVAALGLSSCASKKSSTPVYQESTGAATYGYSK